LAELEARDEQGAVEEDGAVNPSAVRCEVVAAGISKYLSVYEVVKIPAGDWTVIETGSGPDNWLYEIRMTIDEAGSVWVKSVTPGSLERDTFPYLWAGKHGEKIQKFDNFIAAATYARTGRS
jgi:hypothetical protein